MENEFKVEWLSRYQAPLTSAEVSLFITEFSEDQRGRCEIYCMQELEFSWYKF